MKSRVTSRIFIRKLGIQAKVMHSTRLLDLKEAALDYSALEALLKLPLDIDLLLDPGGSRQFQTNVS